MTADVIVRYTTRELTGGVVSVDKGSVIIRYKKKQISLSDIVVSIEKGRVIIRYKKKLTELIKKSLDYTWNKVQQTKAGVLIRYTTRQFSMLKMEHYCSCSLSM